MVVQYASGAEGSIWSFFTVTPSVICKLRGSVVPLVLPQIIITVGISFLALYLKNRSEDWGEPSQPLAFSILVSFLLVFKTQNAYSKFWQALTHVNSILQSSRTVASIACTMFDWEKNSEIPVRARRIVRLLVLNFFVIIEYFQRTGPDATKDNDKKDSLREDIRKLTGPHEFKMLYPSDNEHTPGSESTHACANVAHVLNWINLAGGRVMKQGGVPPPIMSAFIGQVHNLHIHVEDMEVIDKTQFPLPYNQVIKLLLSAWTFSVPFFLVAQMHIWTPAISALVALGYFGLDEVAEILESPFGNDPNDIYLRKTGVQLMYELEMIYNSRDAQLDTVLPAEEPMRLSNLLLGRFSDVLADMTTNPSDFCIEKISSGSLKAAQRTKNWSFSQKKTQEIEI